MKDFIKIPEKRKRILKKDKRIIEESTNTKIIINDDIEIEGKSFDVFQAKQILKAYGRGFDANDSIMLLDDNCGLEIIELTEFTKSKNRLMVLKGRIIGTKGKTKKIIEEHTDTKLSVFGKTISILGKWDKIDVSKQAVMMIINGSSHKTLYKWLEKQHSKGEIW